jgi:Tol biopolymer transport system component
VFTRRTAGTPIRELWLVRPDGTGLRQLTTLQAVSEAPAWSPDGRRIAFASNVDGQFDIYSIGLDGRDRRAVTVTAEDSFEPAWSPDGSTIAYSEGGAIVTVELGEEGEATKLTDSDNNDSSPAWNPQPPPES